VTGSQPEQTQRSKAGLLHFFDGLRYGSRGLRAALTHAEAFRQELVVFAIAVVAAVLLGDSAFERAILIGVLFPVLIAELVNTAIETVVDRIGTEHHDLSGRAKDLAAGAVLLSIIGATVVWLLVLLG
jgi:diacylglycerol kinase (ATP)